MFETKPTLFRPSIKNLEKLTNNDSSHIFKIKQPFTILLHPIYLGKIDEGIKLELDALINKYSNEFNGILMGYTSIKICSNIGRGFDTFPFIHIDIQGNFFIFRPNIGDIIEGAVVKTSPHHVGCLVHGLFNVSCFIPKSTRKEEWIGSTAQEEDILSIQICNIDMKSIVPEFRGIIEANNGNVYSENGHKDAKLEDDHSTPVDQSFEKLKKYVNPCSDGLFNLDLNRFQANEDTLDLENLQNDLKSVNVKESKKRKKKSKQDFLSSDSINETKFSEQTNGKFLNSELQSEMFDNQEEFHEWETGVNTSTGSNISLCKKKRQKLVCKKELFVSNVLDLPVLGEPSYEISNLISQKKYVSVKEEPNSSSNEDYDMLLKKKSSKKKKIKNEF